MTVPTPPAPQQAGQRLLLINGVTWAVMVIVLGYAVFNPAPPPPFADRGGAGFLRVPGPAGPAPSATTPAGENGGPFKLRGMAAAGSGLEPPPDEKREPAKDAAPGKTESQKPGEPQKPGGEPPVQLRSFGPAGSGRN